MGVLLQLAILGASSQYVLATWQVPSSNETRRLEGFPPDIATGLGNLWPLTLTSTVRPAGARQWLKWLGGDEAAKTVAATPCPVDGNDRKGKSIFGRFFGRKSPATKGNTTSTASPLPKPLQSRKIDNPAPKQATMPAQPNGALQRDDKARRSGWFDFWGHSVNSGNTTATSTEKTTVRKGNAEIVSDGKKLGPGYDAMQNTSSLFTECLERCDESMKSTLVLTLDNSYAVPVVYVNQYVGCADKCVQKYLKKPSGGVNLFDLTDDSFKSKVIRCIYIIGHSWLFAFVFVSCILILGGWLLGFGEKVQKFGSEVWKYISELRGTVQDNETSVSPFREQFDEFLYRSGQVCVYVLSAQYLPDSVAQYIPWSDAAARIEAQGRNAWMQHTTEAQDGSSFSRRPYGTADVPEFRRVSQPPIATSTNKEAGSAAEGVPLLNSNDGCELTNIRPGDAA